MRRDIITALELMGPLILPGFIAPVVCAFALAYIGMTSWRIGMGRRIALVGCGAVFLGSLVWFCATLIHSVLRDVPLAFALLSTVVWVVTVVRWIPRASAANAVFKQ